MIFVTVGTNEAPFDRLILALDDLARGEEVVVQHGASAVRPPGATSVDFMPFGELTEAIRRARVVVMHAGVGSMLAALANGKRPIVVPRRARHGEAVDDHQLPLARNLAAEGLVTLVEDPADLAAAVIADGAATEVPIRMDERLVADLRSFLIEAIARSAPD